MRCPVTTEGDADTEDGAGALLVVSAGLDLEPLQGLREVSGQLTVEAGEGEPHSDPLAGLAGLERAGGIRLSELELRDLPGLRNLRGVGRSAFECEGGPPCEVTAALSGELVIGRIDGLRSLAGLEALEVVDAWAIEQSRELLSLDGAPALRRVGQLVLSDNVSLSDLSGFGGVSVGSLTLRGAPVTDLTADAAGARRSPEPAQPRGAASRRRNRALVD